MQVFWIFFANLSDFFAYFDRFGYDMRSAAGFEEENDITAAEEETAQFFTLTNWDLKFEI